MSFFTNLRAFLNNYAWDCFYHLKGLGFSLVLLFFVLGMIFNLLGRKGSGEEIFSLLSRAVIVIFVLVFFRQIVEGFKDLVWAIELQIHSVSFEAQVGKMFDPSDKTLSTYFLKLFLLIAKLLFFLLQLAFSYLWVFCIAAAPLLIPMFLSPFFESYAQKWLSFTIGLLLVRIPWALLAKCMSVLSVQKFDNFLNGGFAAITLPLFLGVLAVAASAFVLTGGGSMLAPGVSLLSGMKGHALNAAAKGKSALFKKPKPFPDFEGEGTDKKIIPSGIPNLKGERLSNSVSSKTSSSQVAAGQNVKSNPASVAASMNGSSSQSASQSTSSPKAAVKNNPQNGATASKGNVPSQSSSPKVNVEQKFKANPVAVAASMNKLPSQIAFKAVTPEKVIPKSGEVNASSPSKGSVGVLKS